MVIDFLTPNPGHMLASSMRPLSALIYTQTVWLSWRNNDRTEHIACMSDGERATGQSPLCCKFLDVLFLLFCFFRVPNFGIVSRIVSKYQTKRFHQ